MGTRLPTLGVRWLLIGVAVVLLGGAGLLARAAYRRSTVQDTLNSFAPFTTPPVEIVFPDTLPDTTSNRELLDPGVRSGAWAIRTRGGTPPALQVLLTEKGQRWFSVVGHQITATFGAGTREVTAVQGIEENFPTQRVRFRYAWQNLHPGTAVLGDAAPVIGKETEGDALLSNENGNWRPLQWSTPDLDAAAGRFRALQQSEP